MNVDSLVAQFAQACLPLVVSGEPITRGGGFDIFQMDILRKGGERFVLFKGAANNRVLVQGRDASKRQLVLLVDEPRRPFTVNVYRTAVTNDDEVVSRKGNSFTVRRWTDGSKRHLLCGQDEQHLFVAPLSARVSTVGAAHQALFNPNVKDAEAKTGAKAIRQGEWFFVPARAEQLSELAVKIGKSAFVRHHTPVTDLSFGRRGRPHWVDELVVVGAQVFARGSVRHPDHKTVRLIDWHQVFGNREAPQLRGVTWVD
ncbi:MAG: hypothetical protein QM723_09405 [Myxococcaceae bacterium]